MLTIKTFRAYNVRTFRDLNLKFKRGTIGVFGPNGSGKSTLLNLMLATITNDFKSFYGSRSRMISDFADKGADSFVTMTAEANGTPFSISRTFPKGNLLVLGDGDAEDGFEKDADIELQLTKLGINTDLLSMASFIPQNRINQFMAATNAERAKAYQVMVSADFLESIWDRLGKFISTKQKIIDGFVDLSSGLVEQNVELGRQIDTKQIALTKLTKVNTALEEELAEARKNLVLCDQAATAKKEGVKARQALDDAEASLAEAQATVKRLSGKSGRSIKDMRAEVEKHKSVMVQWRGWYAYQKPLFGLHHDKAKITEARQALAKMRKGVVKVDLDGAELSRKMGSLESAIKKANDSITAWTKKKVGECNACGQPITDAYLKKQIQELRKQVEKDQAEYEEVKLDYTAVQVYLEINTRILNASSKLQAMEDEFKRNLKKLPAKVDKPETLKQLRTVRKPNLRPLLRDLKKAESQAEKLKKAEDSVISLTASRDAASKAREIAKTKYLAVKAFAEEGAKEKIREQIKALEARQSEERTLATEIRLATEQRDRNYSTIRKSSDDRERWNEEKEKLEVLKRVREKLHRDALPRVLATRAQQELMPAINDSLELYGDKFWAEAAEDLSFTLHFPDREPKNSAELSVGQQVVLALSFWDAVADFFHLGVQSFDEPTANLDAENIGYLRDVLTTMTDSSRGRRQIFVVSHEPALKSSFQQVIEL
jgi:DNA repair exonuclease SbcCD ATPase subunit